MSVKPAAVAVLLLGVLLLSPFAIQDASAQRTGATVGVYFDEDVWTQSTLETAPPLFSPQKFWVVIKGLDEFDATAQVAGYEFTLTVPDAFTLQVPSLNPSISINVGAAPGEYIVGTGTCVTEDVAGGVQIIEIPYLLIDDTADLTNLTIAITSATTSSFNPPAPGWLNGGSDGTCGLGELVLFESVVPGRIAPLDCNLASASFANTIITARDGDSNELFTYDAGKVVRGVFVNDFDGDGENNILFWTANDGASHGTVGQLDCQGGEAWTFEDSGLTCQPNIDFTDVVGLEKLDLEPNNPGDEILILSRTPAGATNPGIRLTLHALDGTLVGPTNNFEYWALGTFPQFLLSGSDGVIVAGQDLAGAATVIRVPTDNLRGAGPDEQAGCIVGAEDGIARWTYVLEGTNGTTDPFFQAETNVTGLAQGSAGLTVTMDSGNTYLVDSDTLLPVPCDLVDVSVAAGVVTGLDDTAGELWTFDTGSSGIILTHVFDVDGAPAVMVATQGGGSFANSVMVLECHGKPASIYRGLVDPCDGPRSGDPLLMQAEARTAPVEIAHRAFVRYAYPDDKTRISRLSVGNNIRTIVAAEDFDFLGPTTDFLLTDVGGTAYLFVGGSNVGGDVEILALDPTDLSGANAGCDPGSFLWSSVFDGLAEFPIDKGDVASLAIVGTRLEVITTNDTYTLDPLTGALVVVPPLTLDIDDLSGLPRGTVVELGIEGISLTGVAAFDGTILYDSAVLTFVDAELGALLVTAGGFTPAFDGAIAGELSVGAARPGGLDVANADGQVFLLRFEIATDAPLAISTVGFGGMNVFDEVGTPLGGVLVEGSVEPACDLFDVSGDGEVLSNDAVLALRIDVGLVVPTAAQLCAADVDRDGSVTSGDAILILQEIVGTPPGAQALVDKSTQPLRIEADGDATVERDGTVVVPMAVRSSAPLAGVDLTVRLDQRTAFTGLRADRADGALVATNVVDGRLVAAIASNRAWAQDGVTRFELRLDPADSDWTSIDLRVEEALGFGEAGQRFELEGTVTMSFSSDGVTPSNPGAALLQQNRPNPFNPRTEIRYELPSATAVELSVFDVAGRKVKTLVSGHQAAGSHAVLWLGDDVDGRPVASGVYIYRLEGPGVSQSKRMILVR